MTRKFVLRIASIIILTISIIYFSDTFIKQYDAIKNISLDVYNFLWLIPASIVYSLQYILSAQAWKTLLASLGGQIRWIHTLRILLISQFAKYLPGNVARPRGDWV
jgi:uncharacterized membrane protein YbhN (UPF0104 family)